MNTSSDFIGKMEKGKLCLGTGITFSDPTVTEALSSQLDFVWIDAEHAPFSLETIQGHIMATQGTDAMPLVRVPWNDPVLIKPILDMGAAGVIVPWIRTVEDARRAIAACRYPPEGVRGYGPRRPSRYGTFGGPDFCREQNESVLAILQIEHIEAVRSITEILALPGLRAVVLGLNDLAGSMGLTGQPRHPSVLEAAETVVKEARKAGVFPGISIGDHAEQLIEWARKGVQWLCIGVDYMLLIHGLEKVTTRIREHFEA